MQSILDEKPFKWKLLHIHLQVTDMLCNNNAKNFLPVLQTKQIV